MKSDAKNGLFWWKNADYILAQLLFSLVNYLRFILSLTSAISFKGFSFKDAIFTLIKFILVRH